MLADIADVVVGVDTHKHTHTAVVVVARTGAAVEAVTVDSDPDGYAELVGMAERHSGLRAWAIEGTGSYGAGLARFLADRGEIVVELDRPNRPARRNGAKSDPLAAERAKPWPASVSPNPAGEQTAPPCQCASQHAAPPSMP